MSKRKITAGLTSVSLPIFIQDTTSTTGGGLSGVTSASSGLVIEYRRQGQSSWTSVTPVSGKTLGVYLSGGIVADGSLAGAYEVDLPNAAFAVGARFAICRVRGVTNMLPVLIEIELDAVDYQDSVRFGLTAIPNVAQGSSGALPTGNASGQVTVATNNDKTGYSATVSDKTGFKLASDGLALVTAWTVGITGNIIGNLSGSVGSVSGAVGSISGVTFPTNFASLGINSSGHVSRVVLVDTTTTNTDMRGTDGAALAVNYTATRAGYLDSVLLAQNANQRTVQVTGSNHVAADMHESQVGAIHETTFDASSLSTRVIADNAITSAKIATDAITSTQLSASAVTEISTAVGALLQNGPSGEGGSTINVYPVSASTPERVAGTTITFYRDEARSVSVVTDFTLTSLVLRFVIEDGEGSDVLVIEDAQISRSTSTFTVSIPSSVTAQPTNYRWALRDVSGSTNSVIARGVFSVQEAASDV